MGKKTENILTDKNIVVVGLQPWDIEIGSNCKNLAMELSKNNKVLYVNRALDRFSLIKNRKDQKIQTRLKALKKPLPDITEEMPNLWVFNPSTVLESVANIPFTFLFDTLNRINNVRLSKQINRALKHLKISADIIFVDNEFYRAFHLKEMVDNELFVYYIRDYLVEQSYFKRHGLRMESRIMAKADLVVSNSVVLAEYAQKYNPSSFFVGQGCDLSLFDTSLEAIEPDDLRPVRKPRIGYVGALLSSRLDIRLLEDLVREKNEWSFVFIGPEDDDFKDSSLHELENAYFLGPKPKSALPSYIKYFDVCLNPQIRNKQTEGNYPLKIDEYLAMGKPTVATYTRAMDMFEDHVHLAKNKDEYVQMIGRSLEESGNEHARISFAKSHTWQKSVEEINAALLTIRE